MRVARSTACREADSSSAIFGSGWNEGSGIHPSYGVNYPLSFLPRLLLCRLRFERGHVGVTEVEVLLQLVRPGQQSVRHFHVLFQDRAVLLTKLGLVRLEERIPLLGGQAERQRSRFGQEAEHVAV